MRMFTILTGAILAAAAAGSVEGADVQTTNAPARVEKATFAGGCFWCIEAVFERIPGVLKVTSGYTGGRGANPTYQQVCRGDTGHAEAVEIEFDPGRVTYEKLLDVFWSAHDPTTLNRQGADIGSQYRSAIFHHGDAQRETAEASRRKLEESGRHAGPVVTTIERAGVFYPAEGYHQDYYRANPRQGYCQAVIRPKLEKMGLKP